MKQGLALLTISALALGVAGCSATGGDDPGKVELVFRQFDEASQIEGLVTAIDAWNDEHPDVQVVLETVTGNEAKEQYAREANTGSGPDIQQLQGGWMADLAKPEFLMPLNELMDSDPAGKGIDDFLLTDMAVLDDTIWGLPWSADTFALVYNDTMLSEYGLEVPGTWDELLTTAAAVSEKSEGASSGYCFSAGSAPEAAQWFMINYYLWSNGMNLIEQDASGDWTVGLTAEEAAEAIRYHNEFFETGATPESMIGVSAIADPAIVDGLSSGACAMGSLPPQTFRAAASNSSAGELLTAPMPAGDEARISHLGGRILGINPNTKHIDEVWDFVKYLTSSTVFETYNQYPAQVSLLDTLELPAAESGFVEALPTAVTFARYTSSGIPTPALQQAVNQQFGAVYSHQTSPDEAGKQLVSMLEDLVAG